MVNKLNRRIFLAFLMLSLTSNVSSQISFSPQLPNAIVVVRDSADFHLFANLFPQAGPSFDPDAQSVMVPEHLKEASSYLSDQLDGQKGLVAKERPSIDAALSLVDVSPIIRTDPSATKLTLEDEQLPWATAISSKEIRLGARFLRGLVLGSLRESASGQALFSRALAAYLGAGRAKKISDTELEQRARTYFAAARNGIPEMRTEEDFDEHFKQAVTLLGQTQTPGDDSATFVELDKRLMLAAAGGNISGLDGMAMNDVFMQLGFHFNPALLFVLSHELGHVTLGHVPFPPSLTCDQMLQREHDADAFAIAVLAYDLPGDTQAEETALFEMGLGDAPDPNDERLNFGYAHAIRYGFALGGLTNQFSTSCKYPDAEERIGRLERWRSMLMARRISAYKQALRYFQKSPPYVYIDDIDQTLSATEMTATARRLYHSCRAGPAPQRPIVRKIEEPPFGYAVECPGRIASFFADADFRQRLGVDTTARLTEEYRAHIPEIMRDDILKKLQHAN